MTLLNAINYIDLEYMGQPLCGEAKQQHLNPLGIQFDYDQAQNGIIHTQQLFCQNQEMNKQLLDFVQKLKQHKTLYKDPTMPSNPIILKSNKNQFHCTYERPYRFLPGCQKGKAYKLIDIIDSKASTIIVKDEIMQYFGVFLCFLADRPIQIKNIIRTNGNSYGMHCIQAYQDCRQVSFFIDDYILCNLHGHFLAPMFSQPQKNIYMWPCILEKAWFKIKGNLTKRVQQNSPQQLFDQFLPCPIQKINIKQNSSISPKQIISKTFFNFVYNRKDKGYIFRSKKNPQHDIGLSGGQYFYLLDTFIEQGQRMFYIRNPCSELGFRGLYDQIPQKIKEFLQKRNFRTNQAGNFLIDQEQFIQQIGQILIVHYVPQNKITVFPIQQKKQQGSKQFFFSFDIKTNSLFSLKLTQFSNNLSKNKDFCPLTYQVVRLSDMKLIGGLQNMQGCFGVKNTSLLDSFNQQGVASKYLIRIKNKKSYEISSIKQYLIGYSKQNIQFCSNQASLKEQWIRFLKNQGVRQLARDKNNKIRTTDISHVICWIGDIAFLYVQKNSKKQQISIQVNFPQLINLQCISHPEIRKSDQWKTYTFTDNFLIIFEKINLTAETQICQYHIQAY